MSHITRAPVATPHTASATRSAPSAPGKHAPVLITEREVSFSTVAAASARSAGRPWLGITLIARLDRMLTALTQPRPHCARREPVYFETARMSRAMERL
jgi:hypothetical protein